jgi:hypothetical protein
MDRSFPRNIGKVETRIVVEYQDIDRLVREVYGPTIPELATYEFCAIAEAHNGSVYHYSLKAKPLESYDQSKWNKRQFDCNCLIMDKLCADGYIWPGEWCVEVYW